MYWPFLKNDIEKKNPFELLPFTKGDTVLDGGGYVGTFAAAAMEQGAAWVVSYEATPDNAKILRKNMERYGRAVRVVEKALISGKQKTVQLSISPFPGSNSTVPSEKRPERISVPAAEFRHEVQYLRPSIIKLDIEGGEYRILGDLKAGDLSWVRAIFIEFHPNPEKKTRIAAIKEYLETEGFEIASERTRAFIAVKRKD